MTWIKIPSFQPSKTSHQSHRHCHRGKGKPTKTHVDPWKQKHVFFLMVVYIPTCMANIRLMYLDVVGLF